MALETSQFIPHVIIKGELNCGEAEVENVYQLTNDSLILSIGFQSRACKEVLMAGELTVLLACSYMGKMSLINSR